MKKLVVFAVVALSCAVASPARAYTHPSVPCTLQELATIKASLNQEPWKSGYASLAAASTSQLSWPQEGPCTNVSRTPDVNLTTWKNDMTAVYNLARMWYFTGNNAYAQKAHDILLSWANTQTSFSGQEIDLSLGDYAICYVGGADILRGTWPGWTAADTTAVKNYFLNVTWPATLAGQNITGPANKGSLYMMAGICIAAFCDDTAKFNHVIDNFRTVPSSGLLNTLATGEMGETGRDEGHSYGDLLGYAVLCQVAWNQGIDLFSELDNRLLACGEYYARNTLVRDNPFVPFGTIDATYFGNNSYDFTPSSTALCIIQNAYKNRKGLPTPWIGRKLQELTVDFMSAKTADFTTATPPAAADRPAVSLASSGLTLTTLGTQTAGRSLSYANGVWTLTGLGNDVWNDVNDDCQFAYQAMTGDCALVARLTSSQYLSASTKAGLMLRDNLSATVSQRAWIEIGGDTNKAMQSRQTGWTDIWGGSNRKTRTETLPPGLPYWLKIERRGGLINTYTSQDGTSWTAVLNAYYANLPSTVYIGLFICSASTSTTTATFDRVAFTGGSGGLVTTPAAPASVFAAGSGRAITVRWLPSFGATSYNVLRSTTSGSGYAAIASNLSASTTSYVDTSAAAGTTYYYVVQAANSAGTSGNSPQFGDARIPVPMVNLAFGGTANDSSNNSSNAAYAFDRNPGSQWFYQQTTGWLSYDFGANNAQVVKRYTLAEPDNLTTRNPKDWQFQASQDGTTWTTLDTQSNQSFVYLFRPLTYNISNTTAYRYYRLNITANNGYAYAVHVGELGLWGDSGHTIPDGTYNVVSRYSNKPMAALSGGTANGTQLVQWSPGGGNEQKWTFTSLGNGQYKVTGVAGGRVMNVSGNSGSNGANLILWDWNNANNEKWTITPIDDGYFKMTAVHSGKVADVEGPSTANGAVVHQWSYVGALNQQWSFTLAP
jgi:regulation of enolase protein 1 (concanavalin A-like superfamily)